MSASVTVYVPKNSYLAGQSPSRSQSRLLAYARSESKVFLGEPVREASNISPQFASELCKSLITDTNVIDFVLRQDDDLLSHASWSCGSDCPDPQSEWYWRSNYHTLHPARPLARTRADHTVDATPWNLHQSIIKVDADADADGDDFDEVDYHEVLKEWICDDENKQDLQFLSTDRVRCCWSRASSSNNWYFVVPTWFSSSFRKMWYSSSEEVLVVFSIPTEYLLAAVIDVLAGTPIVSQLVESVTGAIFGTSLAPLGDLGMLCLRALLPSSEPCFDHDEWVVRRDRHALDSTATLDNSSMWGEITTREDVIDNIDDYILYCKVKDNQAARSVVERIERACYICREDLNVELEADAELTRIETRKRLESSRSKGRARKERAVAKKARLTATARFRPSRRNQYDPKRWDHHLPA